MTKLSRQTAYTAMMLSIALIIGSIEHALPPIIPSLPFIKLGFSNIAIIVCLIVLGKKPCLVIAILKSIFVPLFVGNPIMILYSLPASLLSLLVMIVLTAPKKLGIPTISIISAITHNLTQLLVATIIMGTFIVWGYAPYLIIVASIAGAITGIISYFVVKFFPKIV